jgi:HEPN domain-containing protein
MQKPNPSEKYELWLLKARQDLKAAKQLANNKEDDLTDIAIYHAQQTAEKALKAFLVVHKQSILKTHDLEKLLSLCIQIDLRFNQLLEEAFTLTPYGTKFRYPDDVIFPDKEDVIQAIDYAEKIFTNVKKIINEKSDPNLRLF